MVSYLGSIFVNERKCFLVQIQIQNQIKSQISILKKKNIFHGDKQSINMALKILTIKNTTNRTKGKRIVTIIRNSPCMPKLAKKYAPFFMNSTHNRFPCLNLFACPNARSIWATLKVKIKEVQIRCFVPYINIRRL